MNLNQNLKQQPIFLCFKTGQVHPYTQIFLVDTEPDRGTANPHLRIIVVWETV